MVQPEGLTASAQYLMGQGPHIVEQAMSANGGIMFSFRDQLFFIPTSQIILQVPDPVSLQAGAPTVSILPTQPTTTKHTTITQPQLEQDVDTIALLCERLDQLEHSLAQAAPAEQLPIAGGAGAAAAGQLPGTSMGGTLHQAAAEHLPAACSVSVDEEQLQGSCQREEATAKPLPETTSSLALQHAELPMQLSPAAPSWPQPALDPTLTALTPTDFLPVASRTRSQQALTARRDSLRAHGILDQVPRVTPVMMLSGMSPGQYLHIQEMGTGRPANGWRVAIFDTGADCALCSTGFAQSNELAYGARPITVNTADGSSTVTLGELSRPLEFWLAKDGSSPCRAVSTVQVMPGVDKLFDLLLSVEIITQWSAHACCITSRLVYFPSYWTTGVQGDAHYLPVMLVRPELEESTEEQDG